MAKLIKNGIEMSLKRMLSFLRYTTAYKVINELPKKYHKYYLLFFLHVQKMSLCTYVHIQLHILVIMEAI